MQNIQAGNTALKLEWVQNAHLIHMHMYLQHADCLKVRYRNLNISKIMITNYINQIIVQIRL